MAAARFGRLFRCDPFALLDRVTGPDWDIVTALYEAAARDLEREARRRG